MREGLFCAVSDVRGAVVSILIIVSVLVCYSCGNFQEKASGKRAYDGDKTGCGEIHSEKIDESITGWCDPHTFRLFSSAIPPIEIKDAELRKSKSKEIALEKSKREMLVKFMGNCIETPYVPGFEKHPVKEGPAQKRMRDDVEKIIREGRVIACRWDAGQQCFLVFEVHRKDLRRWAESACNE